VRYEDLAANPEAAISDFCARLGGRNEEPLETEMHRQNPFPLEEKVTNSGDELQLMRQRSLDVVELIAEFTPRSERGYPDPEPQSATPVKYFVSQPLEDEEAKGAAIRQFDAMEISGTVAAVQELQATLKKEFAVPSAVLLEDHQRVWQHSQRRFSPAVHWYRSKAGKKLMLAVGWQLHQIHNPDAHPQGS
jgi:hypothetical protein